MKPEVQELLSLLQVERLEYNLFRGVSGEIGSPQVFGGQVLGQALMAAATTVETSRSVHSLHAYFLRPGDKNARIVYDVERIRDGGSFTTRRVVAIQHGRPIFNLAASFHVPEEGVSHQDPMPRVTGPEGLESDRQLRRRILGLLPERQRAAAKTEGALDFRPVEPYDPLDPKPGPSLRHTWLRLADRAPDDPLLHQALLAYASDFGLLQSAMIPHGLSFVQPTLQVASLDHAMWFHDAFRMDEWLLYSMESPAAGGARGFCRGSLYTQDGRRVASVAQEGLIRVRKPQPE
jgi:acyl-CoA thioesterase-2